MRAGIFGVGSALPADVIGNARLTETLDTTDEWIVKRTGIHERHWLNGRQTLADLAARGLRRGARRRGPPGGGSRPDHRRDDHSRPPNPRARIGRG